MITLLLIIFLLLVIVGALYLAKSILKTPEEFQEANFESTLLVLDVPRNNDKTEMAAEQFFASLHGILRDENELKAGYMQEHLSFEISSINGQIRFYVWVPKKRRVFVESQIYSQYPTVQIREADEDYTKHADTAKIVYTGELHLTDNDVLPIQTFRNFDVDPLAGITAALAKADSVGEDLWIQILARPIHDDWHKKSSAWVNEVKAGGKTGTNPLLAFLKLFRLLWETPEAKPDEVVALSERDKGRISAVEEKAHKLGYSIKIRLAYVGVSEENARLRLQALSSTFKQFNSTNLNGFTNLTNTSWDKASVEKFKTRKLESMGFILNIEELASLYHLPHTNVETPNIVWANAKTAEPPVNLPVIIPNDAKHNQGISPFGVTNFRGINLQFGINRRDRGRHIYIIGQTGAGKSGLLELLALSDAINDEGYAIIDPHGDYAINNMKFIPKHRVKDVIYFNPADIEHPLGFNPLELHDPSQKPQVLSEVIGVMKRMFGYSWGPRMEHILRFTILALLDRPETTFLDIQKILTDDKFRKDTLAYCTDVSVLNFWKAEFGQMNEKMRTEAISPILNKVGAFTANPIIRNIIGQPHSSFNIRKIMDEGKILVINLSKGLIGEDNAATLGSFIVTKIQVAAMSRSDIPRVEDRRPFYLYVDEFQNFATESFSVILSEARKYALNLTVANQYINQMEDVVRDAVFGNVGTTISFRVSPEDAPILAKQFEPQFDAEDLVQMNNRNFVTSMMIQGEKVPAFSGVTLDLPKASEDYSEEIIENSRRNYSRGREEVELMIRNTVAIPDSLSNKLHKETQALMNEQKKNLPKQTQASMISGAYDANPLKPLERKKPYSRIAENIPPAPTPKSDSNETSKQVTKAPQPQSQIEPLANNTPKSPWQPLSNIKNLIKEESSLNTNTSLPNQDRAKTLTTTSTSIPSAIKDNRIEPNSNSNSDNTTNTATNSVPSTKTAPQRSNELRDGVIQLADSIFSETTKDGGSILHLRKHREDFCVIPKPGEKPICGPLDELQKRGLVSGNLDQIKTANPSQTPNKKRKRRRKKPNTYNPNQVNNRPNINTTK